MDAYATTLSVKSSMEFSRIAATVGDALVGKSFMGQYLTAYGNPSPDGRKFQVGTKGLQLELWRSKNGGAVLQVGSEYLDRMIGDVSDNLIKGALMVLRMRKANAACAPMVEICETAEAAILAKDPTAKTLVADKLADFVKQ